MKEVFNFNQIRKIRNFLLNYPKDMTLEKLFIKLDQKLIQNANSVDKILNFRMETDLDEILSEWYPVINKSSAIGNLFNELENICVLDRN